jgi:DNA-binding GntR family transcriptional regulator
VTTAKKMTASGSLSSQMIYESLREGIIRGKYPQGSRLAEQRLAAEFSISRVPLREAVPRLESDGFVKTLPRRSAVVNSWSHQSVHDLFDLRLCLEVGSARYAARQVAAGAATDRLHSALHGADHGLQAQDAYLVAQQGTRFHESVADLTGNELMRSMMRSLAGRMTWLFFMTSDHDSFRVHRDHAEIIAAIETGDERLAESVAYAHIQGDRHDSIDLLKRHHLLSTDK